MRAALEANPANAGFVRPDATLAVIVMMDEDDCSVRDTVLFGPDTADNPQQSFRCTRFGVTCLQGGNTPDEMTEPGLKDGCGPSVGESPLDAPSTFHDALVELKGDARRVVVGGIIGNPEPFEVELRATTPGGTAQPALAHSCTFAGPDGMSGTSDDQVADPGVRLQAFFDLFGDRSFAGSVCDNDLSSPLGGAPIGSRSRWARPASRRRSIPPRASSRTSSARRSPRSPHARRQRAGHSSPIRRRVLCSITSRSRSRVYRHRIQPRSRGCVASSL